MNDGERWFFRCSDSGNSCVKTNSCGCCAGVGDSGILSGGDGAEDSESDEREAAAVLIVT